MRNLDRDVDFDLDVERRALDLSDLDLDLDHEAPHDLRVLEYATAAACARDTNLPALYSAIMSPICFCKRRWQRPRGLDRERERVRRDFVRDTIVLFQYTFLFEQRERCKAVFALKRASVPLARLPEGTPGEW